MGLDIAKDWADIWAPKKRTLKAPGISKLNGNAVQVLFILGSVAGPGWYRIIQLAEKINTLFYDEVNVTVTNWVGAQLFTNSFFQIVVVQRVYDTNIAAAMPTQNNSICYVYEIDDDLFNIPPSNPAHETFSKTENQNIMVNLIKRSDYVSTSTEYLKNTLSRINSNIRIVKNAIDFDIIDAIHTPKYHNNIITVGWTGSFTHKEDLDLAASAIREVVYRHNNVRFILGGFSKYTELDDLPSDKYTKFLWADSMLHHYTNLSGIDIGICPLVDNVFNRAKSNLKYIEMGAYGIPVIASDVEPYSKTITDGKDGLLIPSKGKQHIRWVKALERLIADIELRKTMGGAARTLVHDKYNLATVAEHTKNWYIKIAKTRKTQIALEDANKSQEVGDLALISCSFNTPEVTMGMLKSYIKYHTHPGPLMLYDNSENEDTAILLKEQNIPFIRQVDARHADTIDRALRECPTDYALVVDTDIVFQKNIGPLLSEFKKSGAAVMGKVQGDRGGYSLKDRVAPWFMLLDMKQLRKHNIKFLDKERVRITKSEEFYAKDPKVDFDASPNIKKYDVGATFYEDVCNAGLSILNKDGEGSYYVHYEALSWGGRAAEPNLRLRWVGVMDSYVQASQKYVGTNITGKFKLPEIPSILYVQTIFSPNDMLHKKQVASIKSLNDYMKEYPYSNITLVFSGYAEKPVYWEEIRSAVPAGSIVEDLGMNYGKGYTVNTAVKKYGNGKRYLFTADSDILFDKACPYMLYRLVGLFNSNGLPLTLGAVSLNQHEHQCHLIDKLAVKHNIKGEEVLFGSGGIAGGCVFMPMDTWNTVGGYKVLGVYAGEDGMLSKDLRSKNTMYGVPKDIYVVHPKNLPEEAEYQKWKVQNVHTGFKKELSMSELKEKSEEAAGFWKHIY